MTHETPNTPYIRYSTFCAIIYVTTLYFAISCTNIISQPQTARTSIRFSAVLATVIRELELLRTTAHRLDRLTRPFHTRCVASASEYFYSPHKAAHMETTLYEGE